MWNLFTALACIPLISAPQGSAVTEWLREQAIPLESTGAMERFVQSLGPIRVIGLGEATHGQRECFEFKRHMTLHLIREHGFRLVAYEANATRAQALNEYVQGRSDDLDAAMGGFGMLIWMVEGNRGMLDDLRAWNLEAEPGDRVEIIGIDVQGAKGAGEHLHGLLKEALPTLALEAQAVAQDLIAARNAAYQRETEGIASAQARLAAFTADLFLSQGHLALKTSRSRADEVLRCARELARFPVVPSERAMRDRGMAQSLLDALAARAPGTKAILWGHNGHITKGPLRSMGTEDTGCGGYLRAALEDGYYALGVAFGSGRFQALDSDPEGKWWFRRYEHSAAPPETAGHTLLAAELPDTLIDFRKAPKEGPVRTWLDSSCGMRSWGGYRVPEDPDAGVEKGLGLAWTILSADYDGLLFLKQTTSAQPVDASRIWK